MNFFKRHFHGSYWDYLWLLVVHFFIAKRNNLMMSIGRNNTLQNGNFIRWFEGKVNDEFENFGDMLKEIIRMLKEKSEISKEAEDLFMKFMKNTEEREKEGKES